jgi:hypothetical protein
MQQVLFHLFTLEMLRISIDYVALFLYIENISVVVDVLHSSQSHTICVGARRSGHNGQPLLHGLYLDGHGELPVVWPLSKPADGARSERLHGAKAMPAREFRGPARIHSLVRQKIWKTNRVQEPSLMSECSQ